MRLEVSDVRVERGGRRVLDGVSFVLEPGEALIVLSARIEVNSKRYARAISHRAGGMRAVGDRVPVLRIRIA